MRRVRAWESSGQDFEIDRSMGVCFCTVDVGRKKYSHKFVNCVYIYFAREYFIYLHVYEKQEYWNYSTLVIFYIFL